MLNYKTKDLIFKFYDDKYAEQAHHNFLCQGETSKYTLWKPTSSVDEAKEKLKRWASHKEGYYFFLIHKKDIDEPIGFVSFEKIRPTIYGNIGLCLGKNFVGLGYGTQVLKALINFIKSLGGNEIIYSHLGGNVASQKLAEKLGFSFVEKTIRVRKYDDRLFNEYIYLLKV